MKEGYGNKFQMINIKRTMKLRPYTRKGEKKQSSRTKFRPPDMADSDTKLEIRNANRSLKKAYRAELKRELDEEIKSYYSKNKNE